MPYLYGPPVTLGPFTIHAFGVIAALAIILGARATRCRAAELGLDVHVVDRLMPWLVPAVLPGAHLVSVLLYFPLQIIHDPVILLRFRGGLSSFGGIVGGLIAVHLFFRRLGDQEGALCSSPAVRAVVSLMVGRFGCSVTHDHPGKVTTLPLAVKGWPTKAPPDRTLGFYPDGSRGPDLGLYELLFLVPLAGMLYVLRHVRPLERFHIAMVLLIYIPARFCLDFLRVSDRLSLGLTPGQYLSLAFFFVGIWLVLHRHPDDSHRPSEAPDATGESGPPGPGLDPGG